MDFKNVDFLNKIQFPAKGIRAVMIQNSNGGWIDSGGSSRGLSNSTDLDWLLAHRHVADAVLVGSNTAVSENYKPFNFSDEIKSWRTSKGLTENPALVVFTNSVEKVAALLEIADFVMSTNEVSKKYSNPKIIACGDSHVDPRKAIEKLNEMGMVRINCEGGPNLLSQLVEAELVDQVVLTKSSVNGPTSDFTQINKFIAELEMSFCESKDALEFCHLGTLPTWEELLTVGEYFVLRDSGTQAPFSVDYEKKPAAGYYTCRSCGAKLFDASDQFDARCGWPAFWKPNDDANLILEDDDSKGYIRVEVKCGTCESHLGHVFHGEGFGFPTDDRYCINAICLVRKYDSN